MAGKSSGAQRRAFLAGVAAVGAEAGAEAGAPGVYRVVIVDFVDALLNMLPAALAGDADAMVYALAIGRAIREMHRRSPPLLCLCCDHSFTPRHPPAAFVLVHAERSDAGGAIANGLCPGCAERPDRQERVVAVYREKLFGNDLRVLPPFAAGSPSRN